MKKIIFALAFLLVSNTAFAAWKCDKVSTENQGDKLNVTMSCGNGVGNPVVVTRPVFRPTNKGDVKQALRNVASETRDRVRSIQKTSEVQAVVDADNALSGLEMPEPVV
jgi:CTP:molybdopterin cytidylyltransferase MocA